MTVLLTAVVGAFMLYVFFRALESNWPESYYGLSDFTSYQLSLHWWRYATFRFLPVAVVGFFVSAATNSLDSNGVVAALVMGIIHSSLTAGRATIGTIKSKGVFGRRLLLAAHLGILLLVMAAAWVGGVLGGLPQLQEFVPDPDEIVSDLWTALFAGVIGAYLVRVSIRTEVTSANLVTESMARIDPDLLSLADELSARHNADPVLVKAILLVENLQRPAWIRSIERRAGRLLPIGTYGLMQVSSDIPLSDAESLEIAIASRLADRTVPLKDGEYPDYDTLTRHIRSYNGNPRFVSLLEEIYLELRNG